MYCTCSNGWVAVHEDTAALFDLLSDVYVCVTLISCSVTSSRHWGGLQPSVKQSDEVSTSKSEAMVFCRKTVDCPLRLGDELLPQVRELKYLGVLFPSDRKLEQGMDRQFGAVSAVMRALCRTAVVKKELSGRQSS